MKKHFKHPLFLSLLIISILISANYYGLLNYPKNIFFNFLSSPQGALYGFSLRVNDFGRFIRSFYKFKQISGRLEEENRKLTAEIVNLKQIERENDFLRKQIGVSASGKRDLVLANVIGYDASNVQGYFLIDKGMDDGLKQGSVVIAAGDILVGKIAVVEDRVSKVEAIISPNSKVNALIQEVELSGIVRNDSKLGLVVDLLPQDAEIQQGLTVISSGLGGTFPSGFIIGKLGQIISSDAQVARIAQIEPLIDFTQLEKVFIVK